MANPSPAAAPVAAPLTAGDADESGAPAAESGRDEAIFGKRLDLASLLTTDPPAPRWLIEGFLEAGSLAFIHAPGGTGKSHLALRMALGVAAGSAVGPLETHSASVLYLDGENSAAEISRRLHAMGATAETAGRIDFRQRPAADLLPTHAAMLAKLVHELAASLVIVDNLRAVYDGDESDDREASRAILALAEVAQVTEAGIVLLGHNRKEKRGREAYRGSTAIEAHVDSMWSMTREGDVVTLTLGKNRSGLLAEEIILEG